MLGEAVNLRGTMFIYPGMKDAPGKQTGGQRAAFSLIIRICREATWHS